MGDSIYLHPFDLTGQVIQSNLIRRQLQKRVKDHKEHYLEKPYYQIGRIIAMFPNVNYNTLMRKSTDLSKVIIRNGLMLPFLNRSQGDHMLDIVFTYF